ncbi:MAG TPA: type 1 glutamine amidotransferase [Syntrophobacteria bacterium]|nr:type 1 glutamine amidotransferase [Syntrophobacteria bacterium]
MSTTMSFLVVQHMPWEGPGVHLLRAAARLGVRFEIVEVWHRSMPDPTLSDGMIVLGGSPNVDEELEYPFLRAEKKAIRQVVEGGKAYLGFCLGHQLLGQVLGARVGSNFRRSVGFTEGSLTPAGRRHPLFRGLPDSFALFKWHGQAVLNPVPDHLEVLTTSPECGVEAISLQGKPHVVGLQFDNHAASRKDAAVWLDADREWLSRPPKVDPALVFGDAERLEDLMGRQFEALFENFVSLCRGR